MIGLLIMTHEALGQAYVQLATHFFGGLPENVRILGACREDKPEVLAQRAQNMLDELVGNKGMLVLTDIFGATPCNTAQKLIHSDKVAMVTGLNAPMMVKAMQYATESDDVHTLAQTVRQAAINGIMIVGYEDVSGGDA